MFGRGEPRENFGAHRGARYQRIGMMPYDFGIYSITLKDVQIKGCSDFDDLAAFRRFPRSQHNLVDAVNILEIEPHWLVVVDVVEKIQK